MNDPFTSPDVMNDSFMTFDSARGGTASRRSPKWTKGPDALASGPFSLVQQRPATARSSSAPAVSPDSSQANTPPSPCDFA